MNDKKRHWIITLAFVCGSLSLFAQNLSLNLKNVTVKRAMEELQQKSISRYHLFTITRRGIRKEKCYGTEECRAYKEIALCGKIAFSSP